jgi:hypothetical protein
MSWRCAWGDPIARCPYPRTCLDHQAHPQLCFFHGKLADGLMACPAQACSRYAGHKPPCSPVPELRLTTTADQMFSDETLELGRLLAREGA